MHPCYQNDKDCVALQRVAGNAHMQGAYTLRSNEDPTLAKARILFIASRSMPLAAKLPCWIELSALRTVSHLRAPGKALHMDKHLSE